MEDSMTLAKPRFGTSLTCTRESGARSVPRHQRHAADSNAARGVDHVRHVQKLDALGRGDEQNSVWACREKRAQSILQILPGDRLRVDFEVQIRADGNDD